MPPTTPRIANTFIAVILLTCAIVFSVTMPQQAQGTKQSNAKRTGTKSNNAELAEQRNTRLQRFEFAKDSQAISYFFKSGNKQRIVTYRVGTDSTVTVQVKSTPAAKPLVELFVTRSGLSARTPSGDYQLIKGKRVLPATTDALSVWLLANNFPTKPATAPRSLYERGIEELNRKKKTKYTAVAAFENRIGVFSDSVWTTQGGNEWLFPDPGGGSDCTPSDVVCTEIDPFGTAKLSTAIVIAVYLFVTKSS